MDVFISYAHSDRDLAQTLSEQLSAIGVSVWWDRDLHAGDDFDQTILSNLKGASCVVVLWTKDSVERAYVRDEARIALEQDKLIPIALDNVYLPLGFGSLHTLYVRRNELEDTTFLRSIAVAIEKHIDRPLAATDPWIVRKAPVDSRSDVLSRALEKEVRSPAEYIRIPLDSDYTQMVMTKQLVWLGNRNFLEVRDANDGTLLGCKQTDVDRLLSGKDSDVALTVRFGIGYQGPDPVKGSTWTIATVQDEESNTADSFNTWSWHYPSIDVSDDFGLVALLTKQKDSRIEVRGINTGDLVYAVPVEARFVPKADPILFVKDNKHIAILGNYFYLWNLPKGACLVQELIDTTGLRAVCRTSDPLRIALVFKTSVKLLAVDTGLIVETLELDTAPICSASFNPTTGRLGLVSEKELLLVDDSFSFVYAVEHAGKKSTVCDINESTVSALIDGALVIWRQPGTQNG